MRRMGFSNYRIDENTTLGIKIQDLLKLLKCGGAKDTLTLRSQDDSDVLSLIFENADRISKFDYKLMVIDSSSLEIPTMQYTTTCTMNSSEFQRIVRDFSTIGDAVEIEIGAEGVTFAVESGTASGSVTLSANAGQSNEASPTVKIKAEAPIKQKFAVSYLNNVAKAAALSDLVSLKLSDEAPLCVEYRMMTASPDSDEQIPLGVLRFLLASKQDDAEDA